MYINGKWYEEPEANAHFAETEEKLKKAEDLLKGIRAYYSATPGWELFEEDVDKLIGKERRR